MKPEVVMVTPKMAREWLKHNSDNRPLRAGCVEGFMQAYERGEWKLTHQGIAFAKSGRLLDGQHRLSFISMLPETAKVPLCVTTGLDEGIFDSIDVGARRTASDVFGVASGHAAVAMFLLRIVNTTNRAGITHQMSKPYIDWVSDEYHDLVDGAGTGAKIWSSAPVRAAAIIQMKRGMDKEFIKGAYRCLVKLDFDNMPHAAKTIVSQYMNGTVGSARSNDLFCRAIRVFDSTKNYKIKSINIMSQATVLSDIRDFISEHVEKSHEQTWQTVVKPAAKYSWKKSA